ncbi:MAG: hypothetical protein ACTTIT_01675 [Treponema sp.]
MPFCNDRKISVPFSRQNHEYRKFGLYTGFKKTAPCAVILPNCGKHANNGKSNLRRIFHARKRITAKTSLQHRRTIFIHRTLRLSRKKTEIVQTTEEPSCAGLKRKCAALERKAVYDTRLRPILLTLPLRLL